MAEKILFCDKSFFGKHFDKKNSELNESNFFKMASRSKSRCFGKN